MMEQILTLWAVCGLVCVYLGGGVRGLTWTWLVLFFIFSPFLLLAELLSIIKRNL